MQLLFAFLAALPGLAAAASSQAQVVNGCTFPVYLWSVDPSAVGPEHNLSAGGGSYSETYRGSGIVLKMSKDSDESSLYDPNVPLTQFQYTVTGSTVYYALADTRGDPFAGHDVSLIPSDSSCTSVNWPDGSGGSSVQTCGSSADLVLTLCG